jgi:hypothetical protein
MTAVNSLQVNQDISRSKCLAYSHACCNCLCVEDDAIGIMDGLDIGGPTASGQAGSEGPGGLSTLSGVGLHPAITSGA